MYRHTRKETCTDKIERQTDKNRQTDKKERRQKKVRQAKRETNDKGK